MSEIDNRVYVTSIIFEDDCVIHYLYEYEGSDLGWDDRHDVLDWVNRRIKGRRKLKEFHNMENLFTYVKKKSYVVAGSTVGYGY